MNCTFFFFFFAAGLLYRGIIADRTGRVEPVPPFVFCLWSQPPVMDVKADANFFFFKTTEFTGKLK